MKEYKLSNKRGEGRGLQWLKDHVGYQYDDCLKWPFGKDTHGYGQLGIEGKVRKAHRVMCELVNGPAPSPDHEASHTCSRGHQACINPRHLKWKTRSENQQDRTDNYNRGAPRYKLSEDAVAEIRSLFPTETNLAIARRFDVTPGLISKIKNGHLWPESRKRHFKRLPDQTVREIREHLETKTIRQVAKMYSITPAKAYNIGTGRSHGYVPDKQAGDSPAPIR